MERRIADLKLLESEDVLLAIGTRQQMSAAERLP